MSDKTPQIGFIQFMRTKESIELLKTPNAFILLAVIAQRARWTDEPIENGLKAGQALIGDYYNYGMSKKQYRTAKEALRRTHYVTLRATHRGTIAKLINTKVFDININQDDTSDDTQKPPQKAPNKKVLKKDINNDNTSCSDSEKLELKRGKITFSENDMLLAKLLSELMTENNPDRKPTTDVQLRTWANEVRLMRESDNRSQEDIKKIIIFSQNNDFWKTNILSMGKLRKQFDQLNLKMRKDGNGEKEIREERKNYSDGQEYPVDFVCG